MKKLFCLLLALCCFPMFNMTVLGNDALFNDVDNTHWAYEHIKSGVEKGYFSGYADGSFKPEANVTRAEAIKILTAFLGRTTAKPAESKFADVDVEAWYAPYANVSDYMFPEKWVDENLFKPDAPITREEVVYAVVTAMQYDYKIKRADLSYLKPFDDKEKIGFGLENYMAIALEFGVISGYQDNTIRPDVTITRGELSAIMSRISAQKEVLDERREQVVDYMEKELSLLWTVDEDLTYVLDSSGLPPEQVTGRTKYTYKKGRVYEGVPYSYAAGDIDSFLDYATQQDEKGIYTISGLTWQDLSSAGGSNIRTARLGNDCGASIELAYGSIGHPYSISGVTKLSPMHGYPRVGKYETPDEYNYDTAFYNEKNGKEVMYKAYSQFKKGDLMVHYNSSTDYSHARMVADVKVVYDENGNIDPVNSVVYTHEQAQSNLKYEEKYYNEELGCDVYKIGGIATRRSFEKLYTAFYMPATTEILVDPRPIEKAVVTDSITDHNIDTLFTGIISSTWMIGEATIDIKDASGNVVQASSILPVRSAEVQYGNSFKIKMKNFQTNTGGLISGKIEPDKLPAGDYKCTVTVRLVSGETFTVRDFDFKI